MYQLHKELQKLPPKPPVLVIHVSSVSQGQGEVNECEQLRRIRQCPIECQQCLTVHDPQEGGAWILHSAGTVPRQGHSALAESADTGTQQLQELQA